MAVLVTGGAGYIGAQTVRALRRRFDRESLQLRYRDHAAHVDRGRIAGRARAVRFYTPAEHEHDLAWPGRA
jgi:nucleoside-diphosphate-sugar epimerase